MSAPQEERTTFVMGFFSRLLGLGPQKEVEPATAQTSQSIPEVRVSMSLEFSPFVELAGTTTNSAQKCRSIMETAGQPDGGLLHRTGVLLVEPDNEADRGAIAVHVDDVRVGYLQRYAHEIGRQRLGYHIPLQLWGRPDKNGLRVKVIAYLGDGEPGWPYDATHPYPVTREEQEAEDQKRREQDRVERLHSKDPLEVAEQRTRLVRGKDYIEWVAPVEQLKREGKLAEALNILHECIEAAERADPTSPAPWYTEQAAIVHRKLGEFDAEIEVLRRYDGTTGGDRFADRIAKATALRDRKKPTPRDDRTPPT